MQKYMPTETASQILTQGFANAALNGGGYCEVYINCPVETTIL